MSAPSMGVFSTPHLAPGTGAPEPVHLHSLPLAENSVVVEKTLEKWAPFDSSDERQQKKKKDDEETKKSDQ